MLRLRIAVISLVAVSSFCAALAIAQTATTPAASSSPAASASAAASATMQDVSKWTRKKWIAAKAKFMQEKDKWAGCEKQSAAQKLAGRKSWQFLYECMTKS
jgi:hypothetical protein